MSNKFSSFIKKKLLGKNQNLVSLDEPYDVMVRLLKGHRVTGIIDAGAGNGRTSKRLLQTFPTAHVYAFEPNPLYTEVLQQYAKEDSRFHPQFLALSDHEGSADLYVTESPGTTSLLSPGRHLKEIDAHSASVKSVEQVEVVTIDEWVRRTGAPEIQLMQFDIQGGELKALRGAVRAIESSTLLVYTEISFNPLYNDGAIYSQIDLFFRERKFELYDIFKPKYGPTGLIMWGDAIFLNLKRIENVNS